MNNTNHILAANIQKFRKKCHLTQNMLARELGVTFQAVSKWETGKSAPDILLLPKMADLFGCNIDELFSRESRRRCNHGDASIFRGTISLNRECSDDGEATDRFTFEITGDAETMQSEYGFIFNDEYGEYSTDCEPCCDPAAYDGDADITDQCDDEDGCDGAPMLSDSCDCMSDDTAAECSEAELENSDGEFFFDDRDSASGCDNA